MKMSVIHDQFDAISIRNVHRQLKEIQMIATTNRCIDWELASALDHVTRAAGMLCNVIEEHLDGTRSDVDALYYIEEKLSAALSMAKKIDNRREPV
ncbi:hypothetical protein B14911_24855 [Bacillus sp. NRRL B-14911]|nr:hypothetical protein B14911_24855 [Bacillus sp. NRRL B-14911]